jgi:hypothetical protein
MTSSEELALLEANYSAWLQAGQPVSVSVDGRTLTRDGILATVSRIDELRDRVRAEGRANTRGLFFVGQMRRGE